MQRFKTILCSAFLLLGPACFAANGDALIQLDNDRADLLEKITNELSYGRMTVEDAEKNKCKGMLKPLCTQIKFGWG
jgi:hypothetical protein